MKTVKAYENKAGTLFRNREDYVKSEIAAIVAVGTHIPTDKIVEAVIASRELLVTLLHVPKVRGPRKPWEPKVVKSRKPKVEVVP